MRQWVDRCLEYVLITLTALLTLDVLWQVFSRLVLPSPSSFTDELARFLFMWVGLLGAAYAAGKRLHLAIDLLATRLGAAGAQRLSRVVDAALLVFALLILELGGGRLVYITLTLNQLSPTMQVPLGYVYLSVPISGALCVYYAIDNMLATRPQATQADGHANA